jgi:hypothetical protein
MKTKLEISAHPMSALNFECMADSIVAIAKKIFS